MAQTHVGAQVPESTRLQGQAHAVPAPHLVPVVGLGRLGRGQDLLPEDGPALVERVAGLGHGLVVGPVLPLPGEGALLLDQVPVGVGAPPQPGPDLARLLVAQEGAGLRQPRRPDAGVGRALAEQVPQAVDGGPVAAVPGHGGDGAPQLGEVVDGRLQDGPELAAVADPVLGRAARLVRLEEAGQELLLAGAAGEEVHLVHLVLLLGRAQDGDVQVHVQRLLQEGLVHVRVAEQGLPVVAGSLLVGALEHLVVLVLKAQDAGNAGQDAGQGAELPGEIVQPLVERLAARRGQVDLAVLGSSHDAQESGGYGQGGLDAAHVVPEDAIRAHPVLDRPSVESGVVVEVDRRTCRIDLVGIDDNAKEFLGVRKVEEVAAVDSQDSEVGQCRDNRLHRAHVQVRDSMKMEVTDIGSVAVDAADCTHPVSLTPLIASYYRQLTQTHVALALVHRVLVHGVRVRVAVVVPVLAGDLLAGQGLLAEVLTVRLSDRVDRDVLGRVDPVLLVPLLPLVARVRGLQDSLGLGLLCLAPGASVLPGFVHVRGHVTAAKPLVGQVPVRLDMLAWGYRRVDAHNHLRSWTRCT